ncbi:hypothetical protein RHSIM_RhsimUnG0244700 [Rhododendron simsii]|uniref:X8 domain-containing protein n=1 Tax=Rhododendron simsii TaxID=118357 RepID=A0A834L3Q5_RHOSS|nr:hypothetical protein RHSIM_RhsimUnG0244700 [Rhododendron simsii]
MPTSTNYAPPSDYPTVPSRAAELWCVAMNNANSSALQAALDWAYGPGGADCESIQQGGPCYDAGDILTMASYAFNDYFLTHGLTDESCNFDGTAALTYLNPSHGSCKFPSSFTLKNGSFTGPSTTAEIYPANLDISGGSFEACSSKGSMGEKCLVSPHVPRWAFIECIAFMGRLSEQVA